MTRNVITAAKHRTPPAPVPNLEPLTVTIAEAERITGVGWRTLYRELEAGRLRAVKRGRTTLILMNSIREYVASLPAATFGSKRAA
jgi:excisionase family DNA binding protein